MEYDAFIKDTKTCRAVVQCIECVGEAARNIPPEIREREARLPWKDMAPMRDKCAQAYFGIDYAVVYSTVTRNFSAVRDIVAELLDDIRGKR